MFATLKGLPPDILAIIDERRRERAVLTPDEVTWRDKQPLLESAGYMLRPRYRPGWVPSWTKKGNEDVDPTRFEDYEPSPYQRNLMDASRISDNRLVCIKRVERDGAESRIHSWLSKNTNANSPWNHCVPLLDYITDDEDPEHAYLVMPFLRKVDSPPFETVADVVDFVTQVLQGLCHMHGQGVAHRDCSYFNIMMDADALFLQGFHPVNTFMDRETAQKIVPYRPRSAAPVKYYYIDFGISVHIPLDVYPKLAIGGFGRDQDVPELSFINHYDPFKVDVFIIGNMFRTLLYERYSNLPFLEVLIEKMTTRDPELRPSAASALDIWTLYKGEMWQVQQRWRLQSRQETLPVSFILDGVNLVSRSVRYGWQLINWLSDLQG